jgi:hypothetical protein
MVAAGRRDSYTNVYTCSARLARSRESLLLMWWLQAEETRGYAQDVRAHKKPDEQAQKKQASCADAAAHISKDHVLGDSGLGVAVPAGRCRIY